MTCTLVRSEVSPAQSADEAYLDALQGAWLMEGTLAGKPVRYFAEGKRVLQGGFMKLHMIDTGSPPQYEADVFVGYDSRAKDYIGHWLDRFGAAGARVVARGERHDEQLVLLFPYPEGAFRDTFTWRPESRSWNLLLETQGRHGSWSTFANYNLIRRAQP
ncbi:MAG TPA: hypothetical protein VGL55_14070 [Steroidobacteraceae bacterium]